ncbi:MAG: domain containing protein [Acidobacteria bacterium]|nr:domain containing protein [Acidobacteriota bacterium]
MSELLLGRGFGEAQLLAALGVAGYEVQPETRAEDAWTYLDTQDGALLGAGLRLRSAGAGGAWQLVAADAGAVVGEFGGDGLPLDGGLAERLQEIAGGRLLVPVVHARRLAQTWTAVGHGATVRLALEEWAFHPPGPGRRQARVRVLTVSGDEGAAREAGILATTLRDLHGLRVAPGDHFSAGLARVGLASPGAPTPDALKVAAGDSLGTAAGKIFARQAFKMAANAAGTRADLDPEYLHDLRVATRRTRAALRLYRGLIPVRRAAALQRELSWLGRLLGEVRDLDVFLARLAAHLPRVQGVATAADRLFARLLERRAAARHNLVTALDDPRFPALVGALGAVPLKRLRVLREPAGVIGGQWIAAAAKRIRRVGERPAAELRPEELHRLRIRFKRLRYACEFFAEAFGDEVEETIRTLVEFQDTLGRHQDAVVARVALERLVAEVGVGSGDPAWLLTLGALLQVEREEASRERAAFVEAWARLPKRLRRLRRSVAATAPAGDPDASG